MSSPSAASPLGVELREHVVEEDERPDAASLDERVGLRQDEREHGDPLLPLRAVATKLAAAGEERDLVKVGPEPGDAPLEILLEPVLELGRRRRLAVVAERRRGQAEPASARLEGGGEHRDRASSRLDERRAERCDRLRPGVDGLAGRDARREAAQRGIPLADRRRVLDREGGLRREQPRRGCGRGRRAALPARP